MKPALLCAFLLLGAVSSPASVTLPDPAILAITTNTNAVVILSTKLLTLDSRLKRLETQVEANDKKLAKDLNDQKTMALVGLTLIIIALAAICIMIARRQTTLPICYEPAQEPASDP